MRFRTLHAAILEHFAGSTNTHLISDRHCLPFHAALPAGLSRTAHAWLHHLAHFRLNHFLIHLYIEKNYCVFSDLCVEKFCLLIYVLPVLPNPPRVL